MLKVTSHIAFLLDEFSNFMQGDKILANVLCSKIYYVYSYIDYSISEIKMYESASYLATLQAR